MHWIVIPFRGPDGAKSRLAGVLDEGQRKAITRAMFQHVLNVSIQVAGPRNVLVATPTPTAAQMARIAGAVVLRDDGSGLNEALERARTMLRSHGARSMTVVAADLPLIEAGDLEKVLSWARHGGSSLARDLKSEGTNVLSIPVGLRFAFRFGDFSYYLHSRQFRAVMKNCRLRRERSLSADLDEAEDLALLNEPGALASLPRLPTTIHRKSFA